MGLRLVGKTSSESVVAYYYRDGRAQAARASAGSKLLSTMTTTTQSRLLPRSLARTSGCGRPAAPGVLYVDRGVIVLNKPPGLVSQGTSRVTVEAPVVTKSHHRQETTTLPTTTSRTAFDDVLDGTVTNSFYYCEVGWKCLSANLDAGGVWLFFQNHIQVSDGPMASVRIRIRSID
jgi:hypothetical protein